MANLNITIESYKNNVHLFYCKKKGRKNTGIMSRIDKVF